MGNTIIKIKGNSLILVIALIIVVVWFYSLNYNTPMLYDDYVYSFCFYPDWHKVPSSTPIEWSNLIESQINHYLYVNGRMPALTLAQIFSGIVGKTVFNVFNTAVFLLFLLVLMKWLKNESFYMLLLICLGIIYTFPYPGQTMLWITGSVNYLWPTTFVLSLLYYVSHRDISSKYYLIILLLGVLIGWMNESVSVAVTGGLFFYFCINRTQFRGGMIYAYLGILIGTLLIVFSPGTFGRASGGELQVSTDILQMFLLRIYIFISKYIEYILPIMTLVYIVISLFFKQYRCCLKKDPFIYIFLFSSFFIFLLGMTNPRVYFLVDVISLVILYKAIEKHKGSWMKNKLFPLIILLSLIAIYPAYMAVSYTREYGAYRKYEDSCILNSSDTCVIKQIPHGGDKFTFYHGVVTNSEDYYNIIKCNYFNKRYLQSLPSYLYSRYSSSNFISDAELDTSFSDDSEYEVYAFKGQPYWILCINPDVIIQEQYADYYNRPDLKLKWYQKTIRYILGSNSTRFKQSLFVVNHSTGRYLILRKNLDANKIVIKATEGGRQSEIVLKRTS